MRREWFGRIIGALIVGVACVVPTAGDAAQVTLKVFNSAGALVTTCGPLGSTTAAATAAVTLPSSCGAFQITGQFVGVVPQLVGTPQNSANQVIVRTTKIKNNSATETLKLQIDGNHTFLLSGTSVKSNRYYGITLNATFLDRLGSLFAATGDKIDKKGFYSYYVGQVQTTEDQIGGLVGSGGITLSYTVGASTSTNTIPSPGLSTSEGPRTCVNLVPQNNCTDNLEKVRTVVELTVAAGDTVTIPNGDHTVAAGSEEDVNAILAAATPQLLLWQNTPATTVNPFDNGYMTVVLICNAVFRCENVNISTLKFGPLQAEPVSASLKDVLGYNDTLDPVCQTQLNGEEICTYPSGDILPKDGIKDLVLKFRTRETGLDCDTTGGTLVGEVDFPADEFPDIARSGIEFHATAGFTGASNQCPQ